VAPKATCAILLAILPSAPEKTYRRDDCGKNSNRSANILHEKQAKRGKEYHVYNSSICTLVPLPFQTSIRTGAGKFYFFPHHQRIWNYYGRIQPQNIFRGWSSLLFEMKYQQQQNKRLKVIENHRSFGGEFVYRMRSWPFPKRSIPQLHESHEEEKPT